MMNRVWVLGDAVIDLVPENANGYLKCPGGAPANVAVGIARLGGDSAFIGRVGQDSFGAFLQRVLSDEGVDISHMRPDPEHHTSTVVVDLDLQGERSFTFMVQPSADLFLQPDDLPAFQRGNGCTSAPSRSRRSPAAARPLPRWSAFGRPVAGSVSIPTSAKRSGASRKRCAPACKGAAAGGRGETVARRAGFHQPS